MFLNLTAILCIYLLSVISLLFAAIILRIRFQKNNSKAQLFIGLVSATIIFTLISQTSCSFKLDIADSLVGSWMRTDGTYKIEIIEVKKDGILNARYYNPNAINVGRAGWRMKDKELQIFVELRDKNYPGSIYQLTYNEKQETLSGTYYQAVSKQTYEVKFEKAIN